MSTVRSASFPASFPGLCGLCGEGYPEGTLICRAATPELPPRAVSHWVHEVCPDPTPAVRKGEVVCRDCFLIHPEGACDR